MASRHTSFGRPRQSAAASSRNGAAGNRAAAPAVSQSGVGRPGRSYPPAAERARIFEILSGIPTETRTSQDWYALGAILTHEGFLDKCHDKVRAGLDALRRAAAFERPAREALLELDWVSSLRARFWPNTGA
jgi:hypothetical protein